MKKMPKQSAGLLVFRIKNNVPEVLIVHPGGPFWAKKDAESWSIPKGEFEMGEAPLEAALREFHEEIGVEITGDFISLTPVKMSSGKIIHAYAIESDFDISNAKSNTFSLEWPPKSGNYQEFPEVDKFAWFDFEMCRIKLNKAQYAFVEELKNLLTGRSD
ncbi:MAG TPA: NUDIX domain-containing protein [Bacteroidales bacterium]|nr:NUDIX domain-containing protein [Bacteroidales bacterium]